MASDAYARELALQGENYRSVLNNTTTQRGQGFDASGRALALLPQTAASATIPAGTVSAVGDVRQNLERDMLAEGLSRFNYEQLLPLMIGKELAGIASGFPTAGATTTATGIAPQRNPITGVLGGAATGASLGSLFGPPGAVIGGGLGALTSFL